MKSQQSINEKILEGFARNPELIRAIALIFLMVGIIVCPFALWFIVADYPAINPNHLILILFGFLSLIFGVGALSGKLIMTNKGWAYGPTKKVIWPVMFAPKKKIEISLKNTSKEKPKTSSKS